MCLWEIMQMKAACERGNFSSAVVSLLTNDAVATLIWEHAGVDAPGQPGSFSTTTHLHCARERRQRDLCRSASVGALRMLPQVTASGGR